MTQQDITANDLPQGNEWDALIHDMDSGKLVEINEAVFDYFLGVLPPVYMNRDVTLPGGRMVRASFGFAEGRDYVTAFWRDPEGIFCQRTNLINPHW